MSGSKKLVPALSFLCLIASSGCGLVKDMSEMHDSTADLDNKTTHLSNTTDKMAGTTEKLSNTTDHMADLTENLNQNTDSTYNDLRQGNSVTIRTDQLRLMEQSHKQEAKIDAAGVYFMSFEFQLWKNAGEDTPERLEALKGKACQQFFLEIAKYLPKDPSKYDPSPSSTDEHMMDLYALAVGMDQVNPNIAALSQREGFVAESMLDIIERALSMKKQVEDGTISAEDEPEYVHETLDNEQVAVYLLRLRANFFPAMTLTKISKIGNGSIITSLKMLLFSWQSEVPSMNLDQIREVSGFMNSANEARAYLESTPSATASYGAKLDSQLLKVYRHMKAFAHPVADPATASPEAVVRSQAVGELAASIDQFRH